MGAVHADVNAGFVAERNREIHKRKREREVICV